MKQIRMILLSISGVGAMMAMFWVAIIMLNQGQVTETPLVTLEPSAPPEAPINTLDIPPTTPLPSLTPTQTLLPPPTLEPPTPLPQPTNTPDATATSIISLSGIIPPLHGLETATPTNQVACTPRKDWTLTYEVTHDDALIKIADKYETSVDALVQANCLEDANMIYLGQQLRVPGGSHPVVPAYICQDWQVLTPIDYGVLIDVNGQMTFNWRGSNGERSLIRVYNEQGHVFWERVIDLRQNETINLAQEGFVAGSYTWQVFPLNIHYQQIPCVESPLWHFGLEGTVATLPNMP